MKKAIVTDQAARAANVYSQAIEANGFVFVAGQIHMQADGAVIEGTVAEKLAQIMHNIEVILTAAECSFENIVSVNIYVTDMAQLPELNAAYPQYFSEPFPARAAVCVKELPLGASVEISVVAAK